MTKAFDYSRIPKLRRLHEFYGRRRAAKRWPYGARKLALRHVAHPLGFSKSLRPPHGRRKGTVRHHFKDRTAAPCCLSLFIQDTPCGYPNIQTYVTAMVCHRGKFCGGRTIIIGRRKLRSYGRRSKCDLGITVVILNIVKIVHNEFKANG